jgi:hypothetical protein
MSNDPLYVTRFRTRHTFTWWERWLIAFRQHWTRRRPTPFVPQRANIRDAAKEEE